MNEYQKNIIERAGIEFEEVNDTDVIIWQSFDQGHGVKGWYYLYKSNGHLIDIQCGKFLPLSDRKFKRPPFIDDEQVIIGSLSKPKQIVEKKALTMESLTAISLKPKLKRIFTDEDRQKRSLRMKMTMKTYWNKKKNIL